jgi:hypothetical protein
MSNGNERRSKMSIKRFLIICLAALFTLIVAAPSSWARSPGQYRLEGAVIGIGALILGKAILDAQDGGHHVEAHVAAYGTSRPNHYRAAGHWETRRIWVPSSYEKVWKPGYRGRHGRWIPGRWERIESHPGHWSRQRVWVEHH